MASIDSSGTLDSNNITADSDHCDDSSSCRSAHSVESKALDAKPAKGTKGSALDQMLGLVVILTCFYLVRYRISNHVSLPVYDHAHTVILFERCDYVQPTQTNQMQLGATKATMSQVKYGQNMPNHFNCIRSLGFND